MYKVLILTFHFSLHFILAIFQTEDLLWQYIPMVHLFCNVSVIYNTFCLFHLFFWYAHNQNITQNIKIVIAHSELTYDNNFMSTRFLNDAGKSHTDGEVTVGGNARMYYHDSANNGIQMILCSVFF